MGAGGRRGRTANYWLEALIIALQVRARVGRGEWLTLEELAEAIDCVAVVCQPDARQDAIVAAARRLADVVGNAEWVYCTVMAWRRWAPELPHAGDRAPSGRRRRRWRGDAALRDVLKIVLSNEGRRLGTLSVYWRRVRPVAAALARRHVQRGAPLPPPPAPPPASSVASSRMRTRWRRMRALVRHLRRRRRRCGPSASETQGVEPDLVRFDPTRIRCDG